MERQMVRLTLVLGLLVTILGGTGVFAVFTDQAHSGSNHAASGAQPHAADLKIAAAPADTFPHVCGTFADDSTTPGFQVTDLQPGTAAGTAIALCLKNAGASTLALSVGAPGLTDEETECTGDEAASGDTTCGNRLAGELSPVVEVTIQQLSCATGAGLGDVTSSLSALKQRFIPLDISAVPGQTICFAVSLGYVPATAAQIQLAQSDIVSWRFVFEGAAS